MSYKWGARSIRRMHLVYPYLIECADMTIATSKYDLTIPFLAGVRTPEQQKNAFDRGASKCDGYNILSYHQIEATPENEFGMALDIRPVGWRKMSEKELNRAQNYIARLMLINYQELILKYTQEGIDIGVMIWGGTFGSEGWDKPHFEIRL